MCTSFLISTWTSFSGTAGGGVHGKVDGIALVITIGVGPITVMFRPFIMTWTRGGEDFTGTVIGTDTGGTMSVFRLDDFKRTGGVGMTIDIGEGNEPGASGTINRGRDNRGRK
jgi:hypothetical protein